MKFKWQGVIFDVASNEDGIIIFSGKEPDIWYVMPEDTFNNRVQIGSITIPTMGILWAELQIPLDVVPRFPQGEAHHVTLVYETDADDYTRIIGKQFQAKLLYEAWNDRVQAVAVDLPHWVPCKNEIPHITVSWVDGAFPVESNEMLNKCNYRLLHGYIPMKIAFFEWESP